MSGSDITQGQISDTPPRLLFGMSPIPLQSRAKVSLGSITGVLLTGTRLTPCAE